MVGRLLTLTLLVMGAHALVGKCGHVEKQTFESEEREVTRTNSTYLSAYSRGGDWQSIRIAVFYGPLNLTEKMHVRLEGAIRGTKRWLSNALRVRRISSPWLLNRMDCGGIPFTGPITTQYINADFALYIISDMEENGYAGYAMHCQRDSDTGQPIAGLFYFNGFAHEKEPDEQVLATAIHEISHSLGFSPSLYKHYRKPTGERYTFNEMFIETSERGYEVLKLKLPTVIKKARQAFACESLDGLELEADGGSGTVGAHWEKRLMYNEYMVADSRIKDIIYSDITLALFEDSGWYRANYRYSTSVQWGFHRGCEFLSEKCIVEGEEITPEFCTVDDKFGCDFKSLRKSHCIIGQYGKNLPTQYQYFDNPKMGGSDMYLDFCPIMYPYGDGDCRDPGKVYIVESAYEKAGLSSRCFTWSDEHPHRDILTCYEVNCDGEFPVVTIGDMTVNCPIAGGSVPVPGLGNMNCPSFDILCKNSPCITNCYGSGYCSKGTCVCDNGTDECNYFYSDSGFALQLAALLAVL